MAKIKLSKTELKKQRDQLKQFTRFLPTLQLKKQQLQMEMMRMREEIAQQQREVDAFRRTLKPWIGLFAVAEGDAIGSLVNVAEIVLDTKNIAGVDLPVLVEVRFDPVEIDLFGTSAWLDDGIEALCEMIRLTLQGRILEQQHALLEKELRTTTQRVNLFEKVKIPEAKENIRVIQIYLGDQQTAAVGRAKIAKNKLVALND